MKGIFLCLILCVPEPSSERPDERKHVAVADAASAADWRLQGAGCNIMERTFQLKGCKEQIRKDKLLSIGGSLLNQNNRLTKRRLDQLQVSWRNVSADPQIDKKPFLLFKSQYLKCNAGRSQTGG